MYVVALFALHVEVAGRTYKHPMVLCAIGNDGSLEVVAISLVAQHIVSRIELHIVICGIVFETEDVGDGAWHLADKLYGVVHVIGIPLVEFAANAGTLVLIHALSACRTLDFPA